MLLPYLKLLKKSPIAFRLKSHIFTAHSKPLLRWILLVNIVSFLPIIAQASLVPPTTHTHTHTHTHTQPVFS